MNLTLSHSALTLVSSVASLPSVFKSVVGGWETKWKSDRMDFGDISQEV